MEDNIKMGALSIRHKVVRWTELTRSMLDRQVLMS